MSLIGTPSTWKWSLGIFLENINNDMNILTYSFFFGNAHNIYNSQKCNKSDGKTNRF